MKKLTIVLIATMMVGAGMVMAQTSNSALKNTVPGQVLQNASNAADSSTAVQTRPSTCTGEGRGYGDGSKPQPKDGTGFGAKAEKRQHRNIGSGKGNGQGLRNGQGKGQGNHSRKMSCGSDSCQNGQRGHGKRLQKRDGSCGTNISSSSSNSTGTSTTDTSTAVTAPISTVAP